MKRFLCLFLVLAVMISLVACGGGGTSDETPDESSTEVPAQSESKNEAVPSFSLGKNSENSYHSDFLSLTVTLPDGWEVYSDEDILEINGINKAIYDEDPLAAVSGASFLYDMYAVNETDGSTVSVILEQGSPAEMLKLDIKSVIESQFDSLRGTCEELGYTDVELSYKKITVDGRELDGYELSANYYGLVFRTVGLSFTRGNFLVSITVGAIGEDSVDELLLGFDFE